MACPPSSRCERGGQTPAEEVDARITAALHGEKQGVLIGGPPCQAGSIIGRSRVGGIDPEDHRVHLDRESVRILAVHRPAVFVMENVRGILSARVGDKPVISQLAIGHSVFSDAASLKPVYSARILTIWVEK